MAADSRGSGVAAGREASDRLLEDLDRPPALVLGGHEREADVALARARRGTIPAPRPRRARAGASRSPRTSRRPGSRPRGTSSPARRRCGARCARTGRGTASRFAGVRRPRPLDVLLVAPGDDRRALHELLRCRADVRAELLQRRDELGVAGDEARAVAGHRRALRERVEDRQVRPVRRAGAPRRAARRTRARCTPRRRRARSRARARGPPAARRTRAAPWLRSGCSGS